MHDTLPLHDSAQMCLSDALTLRFASITELRSDSSNLQHRVTNPCSCLSVGLDSRHTLMQGGVDMCQHQVVVQAYQFLQLPLCGQTGALGAATLHATIADWRRSKARLLQAQPSTVSSSKGLQQLTGHLSEECDCAAAAEASGAVRQCLERERRLQSVPSTHVSSTAQMKPVSPSPLPQCTVHPATACAHATAWAVKS